MERTFTFVIVTCLCFGLAVSKIKDCGSKADVKSSEVSGCGEESSVCDLKKGTNASIHITFSPHEDIPNITTVVHGVIGGLPVPFKVPDANPCESMLTCPLKAGETYNYVATLPVLSSYPSIKVNVKWELRGEGDTEVVCINIPAKIVSAGKK